jgi:serine/arginine repetitive matrix protein 2
MPVLRELPTFSNVSAVPMLDVLEPFSPLVMQSVKAEKSVKDEKKPLETRPCVGSTARRTALGWSKRSNGRSTGQKENVAVGKENLVGTSATTCVAFRHSLEMILMSCRPGNTLRLSRSCPKGRTLGGRTPASQTRSIRI